LAAGIILPAVWDNLNWQGKNNFFRKFERIYHKKGKYIITSLIKNLIMSLKYIFISAIIKMYYKIKILKIKTQV